MCESEGHCCVRLLVTPWTVTCQALLSMEFPSKSTRVGCHSLLLASHSCFDLHFPDDIRHGASLRMLMYHLRIFPGSCLGPQFLKLGCVVIVELNNSLYILGNIYQNNICYLLQIFTPYVDFLILLTLSFANKF